MTVEQVQQIALQLGLNPRLNGRGFSCYCPVHGDTQTRHLYVSAGDKVQILLNCKHGCAAADIVAALQLTPQDVGAGRPVQDHGVWRAYEYRDEGGNISYESVRGPFKDGSKAKFRRPDPVNPGQYLWGLDRVRRVLYNLPALRRAQPGDLVLDVEGEPDVETCGRAGFIAFTNPGGAGGWNESYLDFLPPGVRVVILRDYDTDGLKLAERKQAAYRKRAIPHVLLELPGLEQREKHGEDVSDWLGKYGHSLGELRELVAAAFPKEEPFVASVALVAVCPEYEAPRDLAPEALYGIAGDVVRTFDPHTESAPVAILGSFLVIIGNVIGRNPHYWIEGARHGTNLFLNMVGPTAAGRKGTATRRIDELILCSISNEYTKNIVRGLSSGEGLIHHIRDSRTEKVPVKKSGRFTGEYDEVMVDEGVADKRMMVREEEFSNVLKVANREGNTLSARIREAWDNVSMGSLTKGSKETATDPHISIVGHITETELRRHLTETEAGNGFANRFLWIATHRSKFLPRGGGQPNLAPLSYRIHELVEIAQRLDRFEFDDKAGAIWDAVYPTLSAGHPGLLGAVTSRAEAQVLRLSVLYAVLDGIPVISTGHLLAALAFWEFSFRSCEYIFGTATGDEVADGLEEALLAVYPGYLTRTEIRDQFGRHMVAGRIPRALATLTREHRAQMRTIQTGGRPSENWQAILRTDRDKSDKSDKSPLQQARSLLRRATT